MLNRNLFGKSALWVGVLIVGVAGMSGCKSDDASSSSAGESAQPVKASIFQPETAKGGAQLWAENCARCHEFRPPQYYSDAQWSMVVHHMRVRADLTGEEAREITKFLQAAN